MESDNLESGEWIRIFYQLYHQDYKSFVNLLLGLSTGSLSFLLIKYMDNYRIMREVSFRCVIGSLLLSSVFGMAVHYYIYSRNIATFVRLELGQNSNMQDIVKVLSKYKSQMLPTPRESNLRILQCTFLLLALLILIVNVFIVSN